MYVFSNQSEITGAAIVLDRARQAVWGHSMFGYCFNECTSVVKENAATLFCCFVDYFTQNNLDNY